MVPWFSFMLHLLQPSAKMGVEGPQAYTEWGKGSGQQILKFSVNSLDVAPLPPFHEAPHLPNSESSENSVM